MPDFGSMFRESKGAPITYQGKELIMAAEMPAAFGERFLVTIESTKSRYPQGVGISKGLMIFGERVERAVAWEYFSLAPAEREHRRSTLPFSFDVTCRNRSGKLLFYNMTEVEGRQDWWHGGAAMIREEIPGGIRLRCNDSELDDDFDDIVFTVEHAT